MHKQVQTVIAAARILIRNPSEQKLASDDMRYLLHNILDEYNATALKRNRDYFSFSEVVTFAYDSATKAFTPTLTVSDLSEFYPVHLLYQDVNSDPDTDAWHPFNRVKIAQFPTESNSGQPTYAVLETALGSARSIQFRMNVTDEFVQERRWRLDYRAFPTEVLAYDALVPFPQEHTILLEHALAFRGIRLVRDNSDDWMTFKATETSYLQMEIMKYETAFREWLDKDIQNIILSPTPFHYITNNAQNRGRFRNLRTDHG